MNDLQTKRCMACEAGIPPLKPEEIKKFMAQLPEWKMNENQKVITRRFAFKGFYKTMAFVNAVAWIANQENHHPDLQMGYNYCVVNFTTHALDGLSENDFICAAKVDALGAE